MKIAPQIAVPVAKDRAVARSAVKVCLHIVRTACTDVRAMRAATALVEAGYKVSIVDVEVERSRPLEESVHGISMKHIHTPGWHRSRAFEPWFFVKALQTFIISIQRLLETRADIYHASEVTALPACYIVAKLRRKPLIYEAYELPLFDVPLSEMGMLRRCFHGLLTILLRLMIPQCAAVIAVSPPIVREIRNRYHVPRMLLLRNTPTYKSVSKSDRLRQYLGLSPNKRIALYQGNLQAGRGLDVLVQAAAFLQQDVVIVLMGKDFGTTRSQLEALIAKENVSDRVRIVPAVAYEELLDWTASADLGLTIIPLDYTLNTNMWLPNKFFEYLMAGLPVLSAPLEAITEIIRAYDVGQIVPSLTPADVGAAMNAMLADHDALARMRCSALKVAESEFCWEKESQQLITLYTDILLVHKPSSS